MSDIVDGRKSHVGNSNINGAFGKMTINHEDTRDLTLLNGEEVMMTVEMSYLPPYQLFNIAQTGKLIITNYRLFFKSYELRQADNIDIPLGMISKVEKIGGASNRGENNYGIEIFCKDMRNIKFAQKSDSVSRKEIVKTILKYAFPLSNEQEPFAYSYKPKYINDGWQIYDPEKELKRMEVGEPGSTWRLTNINSGYGFCETYPEVLAVPKGVTDELIRSAAPFRSRQRFPVLSWLNKRTQASISRSSQPLIGLSGKRSSDDELYVGYIRDIKSPEVLYIMDARPSINAKANMARGGGYERDDYYSTNGTKTELVFLDIHNIHVMRESLRKLKEFCIPALDDSHWLSNVESTRWLHHIKAIIAAVVQVVDKVANQNRSVLVHCSDGWDRTAQVTSLAMLLLDSYYRTLVGFELLIEKEWLSFGHKFAQRHGHGEDKHSDSERSPIFTQFVDCVWQLTCQFPQAFEFNERLLIEILDHLYSCRFGTFLFNTDRERSKEAKTFMVSLWSYINSRLDQYLNPLYAPALTESDVLYPVANLKRISLWTSYYLRWNPFVYPRHNPKIDPSMMLLRKKKELEEHIKSLNSLDRSSLDSNAAYRSSVDSYAADYLPATGAHEDSAFSSSQVVTFI